MSKTKMKVVALLIALMLVIPTMAAAAAPAVVATKSVEVQMVFDGKTLKLPDGQFVFMLKGTTYVPVRFVSYALQKNVNWDNAKSTVSVSNPSKEEQARLQQYLAALTAKDGENASKVGISKRLVEKQAKFIFNGKEMKLPVGQSAYILDGSLYVPVRFMSESSGIQITWNQKDNKISAKSSRPQAENPNGGNTTPTNPTNPSTGNGGSGNSGGTTNPGGGGNPGGNNGGNNQPNKPSYESITANAQSQLEALETSCKNSMMAIAGDLIAKKDYKRRSLEQGPGKVG